MKYAIAVLMLSACAWGQQVRVQTYSGPYKIQDGQIVHADSKPLKCGKYQHVQHNNGVCINKKLDGFEVCDKQPDTCAPDMHPLTDAPIKARKKQVPFIIVNGEKRTHFKHVSDCPNGIGIITKLGGVTGDINISGNNFAPGCDVVLP